MGGGDDGGGVCGGGGGEGVKRHLIIVQVFTVFCVFLFCFFFCLNSKSIKV